MSEPVSGKGIVNFLPMKRTFEAKITRVLGGWKDFPRRAVLGSVPPGPPPCFFPVPISSRMGLWSPTAPGAHCLHKPTAVPIRGVAASNAPDRTKRGQIWRRRINSSSAPFRKSIEDGSFQSFREGLGLRLRRRLLLGERGATLGNSAAAPSSPVYTARNGGFSPVRPFFSSSRSY